MATILIVVTWISNAFEILSWLQVWFYMVFALLVGGAIAKNLGKAAIWNKIVEEVRTRLGAAEEPKPVVED